MAKPDKHGPSEACSAAEASITALINTVMPGADEDELRLVQWDLVAGFVMDGETPIGHALIHRITMTSNVLIENLRVSPLLVDPISAILRDLVSVGAGMAVLIERARAGEAMTPGPYMREEDA